MNTDCKEFQPLLADRVDGELSNLQTQRVDQHLDQCEACSEMLQQLWQMQATASRWQDQPVPHWQRKPTFFSAETSWLPGAQWVSSLASVLVLVLVMTQATISTADGLSIRFGGESGVSESQLASAMAELELRQSQRLDNRVATLSSQQVAANQLVLRTVMELNREERKEDLSSLLTVWDQAQSQREQQTEDSIRLLLASQVEDKRNINQINRMLRQASLESNNL